MADEQKLLVWITICLISTSATLVAARIYVRALQLRNWGNDDTLACLAWGFNIAISVLIIDMTRHGVLNRIIPPFEEVMIIYRWIEHVTTLYFIVMALIRLSIVIFILRLSGDRSIKTVVRILAISIIFTTAIWLSIDIFQCNHIGAKWDLLLRIQSKCITVEPMYLAAAAVGMLLDVALFVTPLYVIRTKMAFNKTAIKLALVFGVGSISCITGVVRLVFLIRFDKPDLMNRDLRAAVMWCTLLETNCGLWAACFPVIQPLLRLISARMNSESELSSVPSEGPEGDRGEGTAGGAITWQNAEKARVRELPEVKSMRRDDSLGEQLYLEGLMIRIEPVVEERAIEGTRNGRSQSGTIQD